MRTFLIVLTAASTACLACFTPALIAPPAAGAVGPGPAVGAPPGGNASVGAAASGSSGKSLGTYARPVLGLIAPVWVPISLPAGLAVAVAAAGDAGTVVGVVGVAVVPGVTEAC